MRVCIFGAGAIGGHLAVRLASTGLPVNVVARGEKLDAIRGRGLTLTSEEFDPINVHVRASDRPESFGEQDVVLIAVKLAGLPAALEAARPLISDQTRVLFVMNGLPWWFANGIPELNSVDLSPLLDPTGELATLLPERQWVACAITSGNRVIEPGVVLNTSRRRNLLDFGFSDGRDDAKLEELERILRSSGMTASFVPDIRRAIWRKLLINSAVSAVSTICEKNTRETCEDADTRAVTIAAMNEILAIGRSIGVHVDADPFAMTEPSKLPTHITSFLQDLKAGRPLEISNGILAVRQIGRAAKIAIPHLETVAALLASRSP